MSRKVFDQNRERAKQSVHHVRERASSSIRDNVNDIDFRATDLLLPPSLLTGSGLIFAYKGAQEITTVKGVREIATSRGIDVLDGKMARLLNMESDAGALWDVIVDKLEQLIIAIEAWKQNALPKSVISYLFLKNVAHTALTIAASLNHPGESFRTPMANKYAMLLENVGAGLLLNANALEIERPEEGKHSTRKKVGVAVLGASILFELSALKTMIKRLDPEASLSDE